MTPYPNSILLLYGKNMVMKPNNIRTQRAPNRYGTQLVKSYLVWQAKSVRAMKMPSVKTRASNTILLSKKLVTTLTVYASKAVKTPRKRRFVGYDFRFQHEGNGAEH